MTNKNCNIHSDDFDDHDDNDGDVGETKAFSPREIIVLDFGDETNSPYDSPYDTTPTPPGGNCK